jgi:hypothetical protein
MFPAGCPACGSDRLKSAPVFLASPVMSLAGRRRYRCAACGWHGWKHRLRRRRNGSGALVERKTPAVPAAAFFIVILLALVLSLIFLARSCGLEEQRVVVSPDRPGVAASNVVCV